MVWSLKGSTEKNGSRSAKLPLRVCTAVAPERTGVCLFIGVLNLILSGILSVGNIIRCIDGLTGTR